MFQVTIDPQAPVYGSSYSKHGGGISHPGTSPFRHRFGGDSWLTDDANPIETKPSLILTLDVADPILAGLRAMQLDELPLCSYVACDLGSSAQFYRIDKRAKRVTCLQRGYVRSDSNPSTSTVHLKEKSL